MTPRRTKNGKGHQFGGDWTTRKLAVLAAYLQSYTTALKDKPTAANPFRKAFIDAFAGTGYRETSRDDGTPDMLPSLFPAPDLSEVEPRELLDGSAKLALQTEPAFDRYIFIERSPARCSVLEKLKDEFPDRADRIDIQQGDANEQIQVLCRKNWHSRRAVLFLDPYGMQVDWKTVEAIALTKAIDLWLLFPLGIGVNRLLTKSGDIPDSWRHRLDLLLGTSDWYSEFYKVETTPTLFGGVEERLVKATMGAIGHYFINRLKKVFAGVIDEPGVLRNSANNPLYLLCFAVGNERGKDIALRIATHLLKEIR